MASNEQPVTAALTHPVPAAGLPSQCPVNHGKSREPPPPPPAAGLPSQCPVNHGSGTGAAASASQPRAARGTIYNVYAQPIDPTNQMPSTANQQPAPGQTKPLSVTRVQSTIPKGGTESTWQYPSPQMFWNSLVRKGKTDDATEDDMDTVVSIHNEMNERTWRQLMEWESLHKSEHLEGEPSLRKFKGMPYTLSPKARLKSWLGYGFPFDRHDWFVDRAGVERRYIIDYYFNPDAELAASGMPLPGNTAGGPARLTSAIFVDVRPAVDDAASVLDRLRMFPKRVMEGILRPRWRAEGLDPAKAPQQAAALTMLHSSNTLAAENENSSSSSSAAAAAPSISSEFVAVDAKCKQYLAALHSATTEEARRTAYVGLSYCSGSVVCPGEAAAFMSAVESSAKSGAEGSAGGAEERAFEEMNACVVARMAAARARTSAAAGAGGAASSSNSVTPLK